MGDPTPAMIDAGIEAFWKADKERPPLAMDQVIARIYRAMEETRCADEAKTCVGRAVQDADTELSDFLADPSRAAALTALRKKSGGMAAERDARTEHVDRVLLGLDRLVEAIVEAKASLRLLADDAFMQSADAADRAARPTVQIVVEDAGE
jgi:hypothetical protein